MMFDVSEFCERLFCPQSSPVVIFSTLLTGTVPGSTPLLKARRVTLGSGRKHSDYLCVFVNMVDLR